MRASLIAQLIWRGISGHVAPFSYSHLSSGSETQAFGSIHLQVLSILFIQLERGRKRKHL